MTNQFNIGNDSDTQELITKYPIIQELFDEVHESGVNSEWYGREMKETVEIYNVYSAMNEVGMYVADIAFRVSIPKKNMEDFTIYCQSRDGSSRYWWSNLSLKEYLGDLIGTTMSVMFERVKEARLAPIKSGVIERTTYELVVVREA